MDYQGKFDAYWHAVKAASEQANTSKVISLFSVLKAKLRYGIGPQFHSVFEFSKVDAAKWHDYIIDRPLEQALDQTNPKQNRAIISDKALFWLHCRQQQLPTVDIYNLSNTLTLLSQADFVATVPVDCAALFVKSTKGSGGVGAFVARREQDNWHFQGRTGSLAALYQYCQLANPGGNGWLIQPNICSHRAITAISGQAGLSTVRIVSHRQGNNVKLAYAVIKLLQAGNVTDNFKNGSTGNMVAAIDFASGRLMAAKGSLSKFWPAMQTFSHCPYSANPIAGVALPYWPETKELITHAHLSIENLPSIGWDLAITNSGPLLVEGNTNYGADLLQVAYSRGLKQELITELNNLNKN